MSSISPIRIWAFMGMLFFIGVLALTIAFPHKAGAMSKDFSYQETLVQNGGGPQCLSSEQAIRDLTGITNTSIHIQNIKDEPCSFLGFSYGVPKGKPFELKLDPEYIFTLNEYIDPVTTNVVVRAGDGTTTQVDEFTMRKIGTTTYANTPCETYGVWLSEQSGVLQSLQYGYRFYYVLYQENGVFTQPSCSPMG